MITDHPHPRLIQALVRQYGQRRFCEASQGGPRHAGALPKGAWRRFGTG
jgi:hypothetical protein